MSDENPLPKPFVVTIGIITSVIAFITTIVGFILLWKGNTEIVSTVVMAVGIIGLWASFFYIRLSRKPLKEHSLSRQKKKNKKTGYAFSNRIRLAALIGIYAIPTISLAGSGYYFYKENLPSNDIVVIIADFEGLEPNKYGVTQFFIEKIRETVEIFNDVQIVILDQTIRANKGPEEAQEIGLKNQAQIVIWGWYVISGKEIKVTYHIQTVRYPNRDDSLYVYDNRQSINKSINAVETFEFQSKELTDNLVFRTLDAIALIHIDRKEFQDAIDIDRFSVNYLNKNDTSFENIDYWKARLIGRSILSSAYISGSKKALQDANEIILTNPSFHAYTTRAIIYGLNGDYPGALVDFKESLNYPNLDEYEVFTSYGNIGHIYNIQKQYQDAVDILSQGINKINRCTIEYGCDFLYTQRGVAYLGLGEKSKAQSDFSIVKNLLNDPKLSEYLDTLLNSTE